MTKSWTGIAAAMSLLAGAALAAAEDAVTPGSLTARPTLSCVGLRWLLQGDDNLNATCTVRYRRKGTTQWRPALPLFRSMYRYGRTKRNRLAGSILHLAPGTTYEVRLALADPDGGSTEKQITVATRAVPRPPAGGREVHVRPGKLSEAQAAARPGDTLILAKGTHGEDFTFNKSGEPGKRIIFRGPDDGEAVFGGTVVIGAKHVWLDRLTVRLSRKARGILGGRAADVVISRCRVEGAHYCVSAYGDEWTVIDNVLIGNKRTDKTTSYMSGEGVEFAGRGHVAAFNDISWVADGTSYGNGDIDVCNNRIHDTTDDFIEPDYGHDNYRVWHNRCWMGHNALSFQPINGGPWYIIGNQFTGMRPHVFKVRSGSGPRVIAGNTFICGPGGYTMNIHGLWQGIWVNNFWAQLPKRRLGYSPVRIDKARYGRMAHNAYDTGGDPIWKLSRHYTLADMQKEGLEQNSMMVRAGEALANVPADLRKGTAAAVLARTGGRLVDVGTILPNVLGPFRGKAPDIGAHEVGLGTPWVGPRRYTPDGLAYGLPTGWQVAGADRLAEYASLGAPAKPGNVKLLLTRRRPGAFLLVAFQPADGDERWRLFSQIVETPPAAAGTEKPAHFRDGLAARLGRRRAGRAELAVLVGARVEPDGVLKILGGCAREDLPRLRRQLFTFVRSLYY